ncbi:MAG: hypothetical protein GEU80_11925 [Dehalococcoidia bacterium]|nr:hypothetical protein [Dehalococcoidia bacterium]
MHQPSAYGALGIDVGVVGRWSRLALGILLLAPIAAQVAGDLDGDGEPLGFYLRVTAYLVAIAAAYVVAYRVLGRPVLERAHPWVNTAIFVGPALSSAWWNVLVAPWSSIELPADLVMASGLYIGLSFLLQWRIRYGGCEVVSLPIVLTGERYQTYCIPIVAADAVEQRIVDHRAARVPAGRAGVAKTE